MKEGVMTGGTLEGSPPGEPKRRSGLKRWALGCGAAVLIAAVLGVVIFFVVQRMTAGPEQVARDFIAQAGAGDYTAAHAHFSAPLKQVQPLESFAAEAQANAMFFKVTDMSFNQRSIDQAGAELAGVATLESGTEVPISFKLVRERGNWKLLGYHIGS
jgi:hypothetical protein